MSDDRDKEIRAAVAAMDEPTMGLRMNELRTLGRDKNQRPDGLSVDELTELCAMFARLRGQKSGPPSTETVRKRARVNDDLSDIAV